MTLIRNISALVAGLTMACAPALAKVDAGTPALLQSLPQYGIELALNPDECDGGGYHGSYHSGTKVLTVCYNGKPKANDHDTVRHEAFHAAQHCAAQNTGRPYGIRPILEGPRLTEFVETVLTSQEIIQIKSAYPKDKWLTELEAFAAAKVYTADQIAHILNQWCSS